MIVYVDHFTKSAVVDVGNDLMKDLFLLLFQSLNNETVVYGTGTVVLLNFWKDVLPEIIYQDKCSVATKFSEIQLYNQLSYLLFIFCRS